MLNRATNIFQDSVIHDGPRDRLWRVDERPGVRLTWLFTLVALPFLVISARIAQLQIAMPEMYVRDFERTVVSEEPIPSFDGRILSAEGTELAYDVERFRVSMHFRWLEDPPDEDWLRSQALSRLSRTERRDRSLLESEMQRVLESRERMWQLLSELAGVDLDELADTRTDIQRRVERIVALVDDRRAQRRSERARQNEIPPPDGNEPAWKTVWRTVVTTLTSPPERFEPDPIIVKEELSYHPVVENVPLHVRAEIEAHPESYPGLRIESTTARVYPSGSVAPHVRGVRTPLRAEEQQSRQNEFAAGDPLDYQTGDRIGRDGVERTYDSLLRGLRGVRRIVRDRRGQIVHSEIVRRPVNGRDIELTLHLPLQEDVEQLLDDALQRSREDESPVPPEAGGSIVAIDVHTGAVLVAASAPRYDLNLFVHGDADRWQQAVNDPRRPFFNRAIQMALPPGSIFKTLTSVAIVESRLFDPDEPFFCQGYLDHPDRHRCYVFQHFGRGHGDVTLSDAICESCNVYFFAAARKIKAAPIVDWARRFEFGRSTGIDLPGEATGHLPAPPDQQRTPADGRRPRPWYPGDTLGLAIGQSRLTVTPLQVARLMAAVANGGYLVTPHVARSAGPRFLDDHEPAPERDRQPRPIPYLSAESLRRVQEGLHRVVADPRGTGYKTVRLKEIEIAGKTGTAEVGAGRPDHAWFAGYVPSEHPRYAFAVVLEHGGTGGRAAGPVAQELIQAMLNRGLLEPVQISRRD